MMKERTRVCLASAAIFLAVNLSVGNVAAADASTPQQVFDSMRERLKADKAKGVHARYQWELSGPNGGEWWIDVNDGTYKMGKGKIDDPPFAAIRAAKFPLITRVHAFRFVGLEALA